jgi:hypothetical protein
MSIAYILILLSTYGSPKMSTTQEFENKAACEFAASEVRKATDRIIALCVPKK